MHTSDLILLNKRILLSKEVKELFINPRAIHNFKKDYSIKQIFQTRFPQYMLNVVTNQQCFYKIIKTLQQLCHMSKKQKQQTNNKEMQLFKRKCCQLLFTKKQKQALKNIIGKQFPFLIQQDSSIMLNEFLKGVFRMQQEQ